MDLALNNLQRLICHKTKQTKPNHDLIRFSMISNITNIIKFTLRMIKIPGASFFITLDYFVFQFFFPYTYCPVCCGCKIYRLHLCRGVRLTQKCPRYDTKQSEGEASIILEILGMRSMPSLPLLPGSLRLAIVAHDRVIFIGQIKLNWVNTLDLIVWKGTVLIFKLTCF